VTINFGQVHVKRQRDALTVQAMGQTPRGTRFIRKAEPLPNAKMGTPEFKRELATALAKLYD